MLKHDYLSDLRTATTVAQSNSEENKNSNGVPKQKTEAIVDILEKANIAFPLQSTRSKIKQSAFSNLIPTNLPGQ